MAVVLSGIGDLGLWPRLHSYLSYVAPATIMGTVM